ncbi:GTP pyrophosphokinase [Paenibacillus turpanensis]|uniref:GTP pyrophosphokinase n=1 Tax=Paenibacillus turpanensis TaxID=2689078 RepID=UPI00140B3801|nr:GTP pyrophosphokinase family protein [Paenibacillus turpanensis]
MDGRDWRKFLVPYEQAVEELKVKFKTMRSELKIREGYSPIEFVTGRVKKVSSILEKAKRLQVPADKIEQGIEDIAGIRIMSQFVEDIQRLAELIRQRKDLKVVYEKDYITNTKESGYRSFHIIIEYPVQTALGLKPVLAEIQIRTLAMNFWATIEHSLNYKFNEELPPKVRERLKKAAEAAYLLDEEMSSIRDEVVEAQQLFDEKSTIVATILNAIQELYFYNRVKEAEHFQLAFNQLADSDNVRALKELSGRIQKVLNEALKEHYDLE